MEYSYMESSFTHTDTTMKTVLDGILDAMSKVKVGDIIICCDECSHDYIEHKFKVESIEQDEDGFLMFYGIDLSFDDVDSRIGVVDCGSFLRNITEHKDTACITQAAENIKYFLFGAGDEPIENSEEFNHELRFVSWVGNGSDFIVANSDGHELKVSIQPI